VWTRLTPPIFSPVKERQGGEGNVAEMPKKLDWTEILPKGYLSPSAIDAYLMCPKAYEYRYVKKQKDKPSPALSEGLTLHETLAWINQQVDDGEDWNIEDALAFWDVAWVGHCHDEAFLEGYDASLEEIRERAEGFLKGWKKTHLPKISSMSTIEGRVQGVVEGIPILGYVDLIYSFKHPEVKRRKIKRLIDFKVVKRAKSERDALNSVQLGIYSILTGIRNVGFVCFNKQTKKITTTYVTLEDKHIKRVKGVVRSIAEAIKKTSFPVCDPGHWKCSEKFCDAFEVCPQGGGE